VAFEIEWSDSAVTSLLDAIEYIGKDSPSYAAALAVRADRAGFLWWSSRIEGVVFRNSTTHLFVKSWSTAIDLSIVCSLEEYCCLHSYTSLVISPFFSHLTLNEH
jgi:hypothetical protein